MIFRRWLRLPDGFLLARFVAMDLAILLVFYVNKTSLYGGIGAHGFHGVFQYFFSNIIYWILRHHQLNQILFDPILQPYWLDFRHNCNGYFVFLFCTESNSIWLKCTSVLSVQTSLLFMSSHVIFASASSLLLANSSFNESSKFHLLIAVALSSLVDFHYWRLRPLSLWVHSD